MTDNNNNLPVLFDSAANDPRPLIDGNYLKGLVERRDTALSCMITAFKNLMNAWVDSPFPVKAWKEALEIHEYGYHNPPRSRTETATHTNHDDNGELLEEKGENLFNRHLEKLIANATKEIDSQCWLELENRAGIDRYMNHQQMNEFHEQAITDPPLFTMENITATLTDRYANLEATFCEGLVNIFMALNHKYKRNDAFKIGKVLRLEYVMGSYGSDKSRLLEDLHAKCCLQAGQPVPEADNVASVIRKKAKTVRDGSKEKRIPGKIKFTFFSVRWYATNNNVQITFASPVILDRLNNAIARYYGEVLGDDRNRGPSRDYHQTKGDYEAPRSPV